MRRHESWDVGPQAKGDVAKVASKSSRRVKSSSNLLLIAVDAAASFFSTPHPLASKDCLILNSQVVNLLGLELDAGCKIALS
jgi:hypothetical protein